MKLTIQRQCDGDPTAPEIGGDCSIRLHVDTEIPDRGTAEVFSAAWVALAIQLGWRRLGPIGKDHAFPIPEDGVNLTQVVVPVTKTWVMCPGCVAKHKLVCSRCLQSMCLCMDGPYFDVRES